MQIRLTKESIKIYWEYQGNLGDMQDTPHPLSQHLKYSRGKKKICNKKKEKKKCMHNFAPTSFWIYKLQENPDRHFRKCTCVLYGSDPKLTEFSLKMSISFTRSWNRFIIYYAVWNKGLLTLQTQVQASRPIIFIYMLVL